MAIEPHRGHARPIISVVSIQHRNNMPESNGQASATGSALGVGMRAATDRNHRIP